MRLPTYLRRRTRELGLSAASIAERMGGSVSRQAVEHWLSGDRVPRRENMPALLAALEVPSGDRAMVFQSWLEAV